MISLIYDYWWLIDKTAWNWLTSYKFMYLMFMLNYLIIYFKYFCLVDSKIKLIFFKTDVHKKIFWGVLGMVVQVYDLVAKYIQNL